MFKQDGKPTKATLKAISNFDVNDLAELLATVQQHAPNAGARAHATELLAALNWRRNKTRVAALRDNGAKFPHACNYGGERCSADRNTFTIQVPAGTAAPSANVEVNHQPAFDLIKPRTHWKDYIDTWILTKDFARCDAACQHYTATELNISEHDSDRCHVYATGYRAGPAGDR